MPPPHQLAELFNLNNSSPQKLKHPALANNDLLNYEQSLNELINQPLDKSATSILIEKSKYRLTIYYQQTPLKAYPVVFGPNPQGDKLKEGDMKTPEGMYSIRDLYPHPNWSKFLWLDYPNADSWGEHWQAKREGKINPLATIGGQIGIHGVPPGQDNLIEEGDNWTWGCISLMNADVEEIYQVVKVGTKVEIRL
ncbi:MAG: L,D-transpeptidase [Spirulinaceae cyanobacterium]